MLPLKPSMMSLTLKGDDAKTRIFSLAAPVHQSGGGTVWLRLTPSKLVINGDSFGGGDIGNLLNILILKTPIHTRPHNLVFQFPW